MYVLLHKENGLYFDKDQTDLPTPFGGPKEKATQYVDKGLAEKMIETAQQFFRGMYPQDMDLINRNAFMSNCIVVDADE